jgi:hypothetical protein
LLSPTGSTTQKYGAVEVQALAYARAAAIAPHVLAPLLTETAAALADLVCRGVPPDQESREALVVTDPLRQRLAAAMSAQQEFG